MVAGGDVDCALWGSCAGITGSSLALRAPLNSCAHAAVSVLITDATLSEWFASIWARSLSNFSEACASRDRAQTRMSQVACNWLNRCCNSSSDCIYRIQEDENPNSLSRATHAPASANAVYPHARDTFAIGDSSGSSAPRAPSRIDDARNTLDHRDFDFFL